MEIVYEAVSISFLSYERFEEAFPFWVKSAC